MILLYTFEGGVKTIIYTDTLQTTGMLVGLIGFYYAIAARAESVLMFRASVLARVAVPVAQAAAARGVSVEEMLRGVPRRP